MEIIKYRGKEYPIRELYSERFVNYVLVATLELQAALCVVEDGLHTEGADKEAEEIDNQIWYYADNQEWKLSDKELLEIIEED